MGYNPINGESYGSKEDVTAKFEQVTITENSAGDDDDNKQVQEDTTENDCEQTTTVDKSTANGHAKVGHIVTNKCLFRQLFILEWSYKCTSTSSTRWPIEWSTLVDRYQMKIPRK